MNNVDLASKTQVVLTREQERALVVRWRSERDSAAAATIARSQFGLVRLLARKHGGYGSSRDELVAEGYLGIVRALQTFDPDRGLRFGTYAIHWIKASMLQYIRSSRSMVSDRSGPLRSKMFFKLRRERARAASCLGETEEAAELVAARVGVTREKLQAMTERLDQHDVSLDQPSSDDAQRLSDLIPAPQNQELEFSRIELEGVSVAAVRRALSNLDARERYVVEHRLMADAADEMSLAEIGRHLRISRERARQLEKRAKLKLRTQIANSEPRIGEWVSHFSESALPSWLPWAPAC